MTNLIKFKNGFDIWAAGGKKVQAIWDNANSRLGWYVGTTEVARMSAAGGLADVVGAAQTLTGIKTFASMFRIPVGADVAGAGTNQGNAAALLEGFQVITGANGTVGWVLPTAVAGAIVIVKGTTAGVAKIYPASGAQINAVGADTAMSLASGVIPAIFIAKSATQWYTIPLLPS